MPGSPWQNVALVLIVAFLSAVALAVVAPAVTGSGEPSHKTADDVRLVEPTSNGSQQLWPFTSRERRFETLTLPINMVFQTDVATTRYLLTSEGDKKWEDHTVKYDENFTVRLNVSSSSAEPNESNTSAESTAANGSNASAGRNESNESGASAGFNGSNSSAEFNGSSASAEPTESNESNASAGRNDTDEPNVSAGFNESNKSNESNTSTESSDSDSVVLINSTDLGWKRTHGGTRYTYVRTIGGDGRWLDAAYQLHNGDYFGSRTHLRLYEGGTGSHEWTAIQAHREHWDWFGLRHSVGSLSAPQHELERQFYGKWYVTSISRDRYANGGALSHDGWVTVIDFRDNVLVPPRLFLLPFVFGLATSGRAVSALASIDRDVRQLWEGGRVTRFHVGLFLAVAALPLVVRTGAIAAERSFSGASPFLLGGPFYLLLVLGLPVAAGLLSRPLDPVDAFVLTVVGLGTGIMLDYSVIGVTLLRFGVVLHRIAVLVSLATVAAAAAGEPEDDWRRPVLVVGVLAWVAVILGPVLGLG